MEYRNLGKTGLTVSRLCFGVLTMGPLQANLPLAEGVALLEYAAAQGVNFFDTAASYGTYPYLRAFLKKAGGRQPVVTSKSYAVTAGEMRASLEQARVELDRDVVDIFLLHEQESALTLKGHREALEYLVESRERGTVRAVGISTHTVAGVRAVLDRPEIDVVHPLFNIKGLGIRDGSREDMLDAIRSAWSQGKGIYLMKALGGGHLLPMAEQALAYCFGQECAASVAVGMQTRAEIDFNARLAGGMPVSEDLLAAAGPGAGGEARRLHIEDWCEGCGQCMDACPQDALSLGGDGRIAVAGDACLLCGYCAGACPHFCLKVY
jgi:aryl-alcohol dehydrogenase-like predicted oxidoreductase/NAD-dependent dihydropyrimidine dehydrogenase PreA subunit